MKKSVTSSSEPVLYTRNPTFHVLALSFNRNVDSRLRDGRDGWKSVGQLGLAYRSSSGERCSSSAIRLLAECIGTKLLIRYLRATVDPTLQKH